MTFANTDVNSAMNFTSHPALRCPLDHQPLLQHGASLQCPEGHNFDIARQGYVNLLSAQDKRSKDPGDSKAMIAAVPRSCAGTLANEPLNEPTGVRAAEAITTLVMSHSPWQVGTRRCCIAAKIRGGKSRWHLSSMVQLCIAPTGKARRKE